MTQIIIEDIVNYNKVCIFFSDGDFNEIENEYEELKYMFKNLVELDSYEKFKNANFQLLREILVQFLKYCFKNKIYNKENNQKVLNFLLKSFVKNIKNEFGDVEIIKIIYSNSIIINYIMSDYITE